MTQYTDKNPRAIASHIICDILGHKKSLSRVGFKRFSQAALIQELCYGVLRWYTQLDFFAKQLLTKSLKKKHQDVNALILVGLYQLHKMHIPEHAAVFETVNATQDLNKTWAKALVNGILRNFLREKSRLLAALSQHPSAQYAHPKWLLNRIRKHYPDRWQSIVQANNQRPPMSLRVNLALITREQYLARLTACQIQAEAPTHIPSCLILKTPCAVSALPGFEAGLVSVQDGGAQYSATLLDLQPGQRVLDACAAPGGKTMHIAETEPNLTALLALDHDAARLERVRENLHRFPGPATLQDGYISLVCGDATQPTSWWDGRHFDRILLDAPCSATGVIRRHPDIKWLKTEADIIALSATQLQCLNALWPLLKPAGKLLYVTCSVLPAENQHVIQAFLRQSPSAELFSEKQLLPGESHTDGFYYAVLEKTTHSDLA